MTEIGRNEPCPCGSGKKYKRCCGVDAAPKLTESKKPSFDPSSIPQFDPQMMMQLSEAMRRLPKGQLQRLQALMQKAMSGKDVTGDAEQLEKSLPVEFQNLLKSFPMAAQAMGAMGQQAPEAPQASESTDPMDLDQAKAIVEQAVAEGRLSKEEAQKVLTGTPQLSLPPSEKSAEISPEESKEIPGLESGVSAESDPAKSENKFGKFWRNIAGRKNS